MSYSLTHLHPQDFDIEVEGTRELKLHVYSKSRLNFDEHCAQGKIEVSRVQMCFLRACVRACILHALIIILSILWMAMITIFVYYFSC